MTGYLLLGIAAVALAAVTTAGVQSSRLAGVRADLTLATERIRTTERALAASRAERERLRQDMAVVVETMGRERARAVAAERRAGDLHARIARDAGTDRDGATAPVLRDAVLGIGKTP